MQSEELEKLLETAQESSQSGNRALGKLIRLIDDADPVADRIDEAVKPASFKAARIGLTGATGSGKSTLVAAVLEKVTGVNKIGVLAVDPTSPFTGGAILGDRVRLTKQVPECVFFRSLGSRGAMGGVSRTIWPASRVLDWWGADYIIIETVGSGQLGTGVVEVADLVIAVMTPDAGDDIQSMKAGVMELADCFIVNKCDRPGSDLMLKELRHVSEEAAETGRTVRLFETNALDGSGIDEAINGVLELWDELYQTGEIAKRRERQVISEVRSRVENSIREKITQSRGGAEKWNQVLKEISSKILSRELTPSAAADKLLSNHKF